MTITVANQLKAQPFDCMQYFYSAAHEPLIRCLVRFDGRLSEEALRRAVNLSIGALPQIACSYDEKAHRWRERGFTADDIVHVVEASSDDESAARKPLLTSIDRAAEPQLKVFLVQGPNRDTLGVIINHMVSDGGGFKQYLYLLAGLYSACAADPGYHKGLKPLGKRNLNQLLRNIGFLRTLGTLFSKAPPYRPDPAMLLPLKGDSSRPILVTHRIEEARFAKIRRFAKINHASVNDMLLAAYLRALSEVTGCAEVAVPCPVDLRKYAKAGQPCGICNLTSNYYCDVTLAPDEPFEDTLDDVSRQMQEQKHSDACLKGPVLYHALFHLLPFAVMRKLFFKISPIPVISFTNLGTIGTEEFRFGDLSIEDAFIATAVKHVPSFQLSASTYEGRCTLTSSLYGTQADEETVARFLDRVEAEMSSLPG